MGRGWLIGFLALYTTIAVAESRKMPEMTSSTYKDLKRPAVVCIYNGSYGESKQHRKNCQDLFREGRNIVGLDSNRETYFSGVLGSYGPATACVREDWRVEMHDHLESGAPTSGELTQIVDTCLRESQPDPGARAP